MRVLDGEQVLVRIFIGESDKWHHQPLALAILERLRREGFAGATVFQGVAGFGARRRGTPPRREAFLVRHGEGLTALATSVTSSRRVSSETR